jgi:Fe2+ or Zn2+ uptake regulation protein
VRSPEELTVAFRQQGLKITPQRVAIFKVLHDNRTHPTADAVFEALAESLPTISLRTVYQTLNDLAEMGELQALDLGVGAVRFDANVDEHHHLVCDGCGTILDVALDVSSLAPSPLTGFAVDRAQVIFHGRCAACGRAGETRAARRPRPGVAVP